MELQECTIHKNATYATYSHDPIVSGGSISGSKRNWVTALPGRL
jgi:hypothetical protein